MDNQNQQNQTTQIQQPVTPPVVQTPVQTPPPAPTPQVTMPTPPAENKNKGLLLVAVILGILIVVLGVLYYVIIKQSTQPTASIPVANTPMVQKTTPVPSPTVTPTDQQFLTTPLNNPTNDITPLDQSANNL